MAASAPAGAASPEIAVPMEISIGAARRRRCAPPLTKLGRWGRNHRPWRQIEHAALAIADRPAPRGSLTVRSAACSGPVSPTCVALPAGRCRTIDKPCSIAANCRLSTKALGPRACGSFDNSRVMDSSNSGGTSLARIATLAAALRTAVCVNISAQATRCETAAARPAWQTSRRPGCTNRSAASRVRRPACSGDMYSAVPTSPPSIVSRVLPNSRAMPKSVSLISSSESVSKILAGFISRCMMPWSWACRRALHSLHGILHHFAPTEPPPSLQFLFDAAPFDQFHDVIQSDPSCSP